MIAAIGLLAWASAGCGSGSSLRGNPPVITSAVFDPATAELTVAVDDADGDALTISVTEPTGLQVDALSKPVSGGHGSAVFHWTAVNEAAGATGTTAITVTDGRPGGGVTGAAQIAIAGQSNHAPVIASATFNPATAVLTVAADDADGDDVTVAVTRPPGLRVDALSRVVDGGHGSVVFTWAAVNAATGASGTTVITVSDGKPGGTATEEKLIAIAVQSNHAPVIASATFDPATAVLTVAADDADGDDLSVSVTEPPGLAADSAAKPIPGGHGAVAFTWSAVHPATGSSGTTLVTVTDGKTSAPPTQSVDIAIPVAPASPTIHSAAYDPATHSLTVSGADANGDDLTVSVTVPAGLAVDSATKVIAGGHGAVEFLWSALVPAVGGSGVTTVSVTDGKTSTPASQTVNINVAAVNSAPVISSAAYSRLSDELIITAADADGDDLTVSVTEPTGLRVDGKVKTITGGQGAAVFAWSAMYEALGGSGIATVSVTDGKPGAPATVVVGITVAAFVEDVVTITGTSASDLGNGTARLAVDVVGSTTASITVGVATPSGMQTDDASRIVPGGSGEAVFIVWAEDLAAGASGAVAIAADDHHGGTDTAAQAVAIASPLTTPGALYAVPLSLETAVDTPVTVVVATTTLAQPVRFLNSAALTVGNAGTYVPGSFNIGVPAGARMDTDGYWTLLGPPAPQSGQYLDLGDSLMPGTPVDIGGGRKRYEFSVIPIGEFQTPAVLPHGGAVLFNFKLTFSQPGMYKLSFQQSSGGADYTYYSDGSGVNRFWPALMQSQTITVN
jgi:hypothetical protein